MQSPVLDNLLKQNSLGLPVKDFLQQVVTEHPYFAPAHFFMLQQLQQAEDGYKDLAAKTSLLFNNPNWLQFKLQQGQEVTAMKETPVISMYANEKVTAHEEIIADAADNHTDAIVDAVAVEEDTTAANNEIVAAAAPVEENLALEEVNETNEAGLQENDATHLPQIKIDLAAAIKNAEDENAPAFEPMHLVDYFASQGIKLSEEVQTADKLGKQLKSFTEWLKVMKKVHLPDTGAAASGAEIAIQAQAEKSNTENEIITEAMADVFAQQGKAGKAIELYQKLSLLNPGKSAYFATQIEKLKGQ